MKTPPFVDALRARGHFSSVRAHVEQSPPFSSLARPAYDAHIVVVVVVAVAVVVVVAVAVAVAVVVVVGGASSGASSGAYSIVQRRRSTARASFGCFDAAYSSIRLFGRLKAHPYKNHKQQQEKQASEPRAFLRSQRKVELPFIRKSKIICLLIECIVEPPILRLVFRLVKTLIVIESRLFSGLNPICCGRRQFASIVVAMRCEKRQRRYKSVFCFCWPAERVVATACCLLPISAATSA